MVEAVEQVAAEEEGRTQHMNPRPSDPKTERRRVEAGRPLELPRAGLLTYVPRTTPTPQLHLRPRRHLRLRARGVLSVEPAVRVCRSPDAEAQPTTLALARLRRACRWPFARLAMRGFHSPARAHAKPPLAGGAMLRCAAGTFLTLGSASAERGRQPPLGFSTSPRPQLRGGWGPRSTHGRSQRFQPWPRGPSLPRAGKCRRGCPERPEPRTGQERQRVTGPQARSQLGVRPQGAAGRDR